MFGSVFAGLDESALIAVIEQCAREEAQAGARKSAAIAALVYECVTFDDVRDGWVWDSWAATACELGAALNMGHKRASGQMRIAVALRDRLPRVAALHAQGRLSARLIGQVTWRTRLVQDPHLLALVDAEMAEKALRWEALSDDKLTAALDAVIERYDPDAVIRAREVVKGRDFHIGASDDPDALVTVWGKILGCDAAVLAARIAALLKGICDNDPRDMGDRRSCAVGAIIHGQDQLSCRCGSPDCTASAPPAPGSSNVVISVLADPAALEAVRRLIASQDREQQDKLTENTPPGTEPAPESEPAGEAVEPEPQPASEDESPEPTEPEAEPEPEPGLEVEAEAAGEAVEPEPQPAGDGASAGPSVPNPLACVRDSGVALLPGVKVLPLVALAEAIRAGAAIKTLWLPGPDPEPHYRPSTKLAAFVRARDLFCRYPGCDVPAEHCDIDHVVPYPYGPTHPSNLNCKCRTHHLGKTFAEGWQEQQLPDGTVLWTTPAGQRCTTVPGSWLFFPGWDTTTAELPPMAQPPPDPDRLAKMPKRRRTRAAEEAARIKAEREHNALQRALERKQALGQQPRSVAAQRIRQDYGAEPPPF